MPKFSTIIKTPTAAFCIILAALFLYHGQPRAFVCKDFIALDNGKGGDDLHGSSQAYIEYDISPFAICAVSKNSYRMAKELGSYVNRWETNYQWGSCIEPAAKSLSGHMPYVKNDTMTEHCASLKM